MKTLTYILMLNLLFTMLTFGQAFDWAKASGGNGSDRAYAITADNDGNSYVTGWFEETANFGDVVLISEGGKDVFLAKYNSNGEVVWATSAGGVGSNSAAGICMDWDEFPIITGWFSETIHFGDIVLESSGSYDMFVARYNNNGEVIWAKSAGGEGDDYGNRITTNFEYDVLVSGSFRYTAQFGGGASITSEGNRDIFVANYSNLGNFHWAINAGGKGEDRAYDIVSAPNGDIYFTGMYNGKAFFGDHDIFSNSIVSSYIAKMDAGGNFIWVKNGTGGANDYSRGFGLSMDNEGYVCGNGFFSGSFSFGENTVTATGGPYDFDAYIVRYDSEGEFKWLNKAGGYGNDQGFDLFTDNDGNSYATGFFSSVAVFGDHVIESQGESDIFIAKYNWAGEVEWAKRAGGIYQDYGYGITAGNPEVGALYLCGDFEDVASFDDIELTGWGWGLFDMFTAKLLYENDFIGESGHSFFKITPNPSSGVFDLEFSHLTKDVWLHILDSKGKLITKKMLLANQNKIIIETAMAAGIYTLFIPELGVSEKIVILR